MRKERIFAVAGSEVKYLLVQPVFWFLLIVLGVLTLSLSPAVFIPAESGLEGERVWVNSRYALLQFFAFSGLLGYTVLGSLLAGISVIRDIDSGIAPIMNSTPLRPAEYIAGKMIGVSIVLCLAVVWHIGVTMVVYEWLSNVDFALNKGPFNLGYYLFMAFLGAFPGLWICTGITFCATMWIRRSLIVYAVPASLLVLTLSSALVNPDSTTWSVAKMVLDPSGLRWMLHTIFATDQGMSHYNTSPVTFDSIYIFNRFFMMGIGSLMVVLSIPAARLWMRRADRTMLSKLPFSTLFSRKRRLDNAGYEGEEGAESIPVMSIKRPGWWREVMYIAGMDLKEAIRQPVYYLMIFVSIAVILGTISESGGGILGTSVYLTAGSISVIAFPLLGALLCVLILMFVAETSHRNERTNLAGIIHSSPVRSSSIVAGRFFAGVGLTIGVLGVVFVLCLLQLQAQGNEFVSVKPFLQVWGGLLLPTLIVWIAGTLLIAILTKNWATTYTISLLIVGFSMYASAKGWVDWSTNWLLWGALRWTDMGAFVQDKEALLMNRSWVISLAVLMLTLAVMRYHRTDRDRQRVSAWLGSRARVKKLAVVASLSVLVVSLIGMTRWNIYSGFQGEMSRQQAKKYWRENMSTWKEYLPPDIVFMDVDLVLDPFKSHMEVKGTYTLVNGAEYEMRVLPFTMPSSFDQVSWKINEKEVAVENRSGLHLVPLDESVSVGDTIEVEFSYEAYLHKGMSRNGGALSHFILPSGVLLSTARGDFLPVPGYDERRGVFEENSYASADRDTRFTHLEDRDLSQGTPPYMSRIEVTAPIQYTVTATGSEVSQSESNDTRTSLWETQYPVRAVNVMAGKWSVQSRGTNAVYYHPAHNQNIDTLLDALVAARTQYSEWFGPFPWGSLRINEFPNVATTATAYPTNISFSEGMGFLTKPETDAYQAYVIAAHEVAHQWWGHLVSPSEEPGSDLLTEAMANYATARLLEAEKGVEARDAFLEWLEERYMAERRIDREQPLSKSTLGSSAAETVVYNKGALVLWEMHNYLGEPGMDAALQAFVSQYALHTGEQPNLDDFLAVVRTHAEDPAGFDDFVIQWIESTGWERLYCADC